MSGTARNDNSELQHASSGRPLSDKILIAFHRACDVNKIEIARNLLEMLESITNRGVVKNPAFAFESVPASASLIPAIEILREMNKTDAATLPKSVPTVRRR